MLPLHWLAALTTLVDDTAISLLRPLARVQSPRVHDAEPLGAGVLHRVNLSAAAVAGFGARCLDGSPYAYYLRASPAGSANADKYVIYLHGGGLCIERIDCLERAKGDQGSSLNWKDAVGGFDNVLSYDERNPFRDWNAVFLRYCNGDTWTGTNADGRPGRYGLYFSGHNVLAATVADLRTSHGLGNASSTQQVVLTGASAGGIGTNNNCNWLADSLFDANVNVSCAPQAGLFFPQGVRALWQQRVLPGELTAGQVGSLWVTRLFSSRLDERCSRAQQSKNESVRFCWDASTVLPHLVPRTLVAQNSWDQLQLDAILCWQDDVPLPGVSCPDDYLRAHRQAVVTQLSTLHAQGSGSVSAWNPSCFTHTEDMCVAPKKTPTTVQNHTLADAFVAWLAGESLLLLDVCGTAPSNETRPCNSGCGGCGGE